MDDVAYFRRRAAEELSASESSASIAAGAIHYALSLRYLEMADAIAAHQVNLGANWSIDLSFNSQAAEA
jgi:hypothetical protein